MTERSAGVHSWASEGLGPGLRGVGGVVRININVAVSIEGVLIYAFSA